MPRPLFWLRPRRDPLPIVLEADGDLGPAGWDLRVPWGLATSKCTWRTARLAGWVSVLGGLGEDLGPQLCSQSLEPSPLAIWGVSGHDGNCSPEDQESPGKADRPPQLSGPVGARWGARAWSPTSVCRSLVGFGDPCCVGCALGGARAAWQSGYGLIPGGCSLRLDLNSNFSAVEPKLSYKTNRPSENF